MTELTKVVNASQWYHNDRGGNKDGNEEPPNDTK